ncbi:O-antigen ligase domain-containing protein [Laspinema sp. A4]|uniref:O-antigen ligase domain-containing protein n=1 Tax=Laspinema sp. D2d TaxID=2953686 RepID=UPI0021BA867E|nr:O-antigen ligase domain-containing protein [Laspinema sp. D2d]MCT7983240.1 O-antigen ligase domain-containing protein [Laspinema sp. D2d]
MKPENLPEKLVWYYILGTYIIYFIGAQYVLAPLLSYVLLFYVLKKWWNQTEETPLEERVRFTPSNWLWIVAMFIMHIALIMGHIEFGMGLPQIIRSTVNGWLRSWALLALFPLAAHLDIRPKLIYRAIAILCIQSLILIPFGYLFSMAGLPSKLYTSPLQAFGGGSLYNVNLLYQYDSEGGQTRMFLFAPWAPALGMIGNMYFAIVQQEQDKKWRWWGMVGAAAMAVSSVSRLGIIALPLVPVAVWGLTHFLRPWVIFTSGFASLGLGLFAPALIEFLSAVKNRFTQARASSSHVRDQLQEIALYRWKMDAPIWGHGILQPKGPKVVEYMPVGSHHTWVGVLFLHGLVGFFAIAIPMIWTFIEMLIKAQHSQIAKVSLQFLIVLFLFTFAENVQGLAYLYWPCLILMGMAFKEQLIVWSDTDEKETYLISDF